MKLRRMGALFVALCLLLAGVATAAQEPVESERGLWTRWWVYDCSADEAQIRREFADIAAKGYRGVEVCNKGGYSGGLGTAEWNQIIDWVIDACEENDLALGLSYQNDSPISLPSVSDSSPEAEIAVTKLVYAENRLTAADFEQTAEGQRYVGVPSVSTGSREMGASGGSGGSFVAVTAARLTGGSHVYEAVSSTFGNSQTVSVATEELDPDSMTRLDAVYDGEQVAIDWTLPADENPADYVLFVWFAKAGGSTVNIFSRSGAEALVDFWLEKYMTERMEEYLQEHSIELFEDSIEISSAGDIVFTWSMLDILETLRAESGYDMLAYLPLAIGRSYGMKTTSATGYALAAEDGRYDDFQFWNEYTDILSDLFAENHVAALSEAFGEYNITYRVQAYSGTNSNFYNVTNTAAAAVTAGGIAEGETLAFSLANDGYDAWRALSGGVHMAGGQLVSNEYAAVANYGWRMTFADMADIANKSVAGGASHFINHGYNSSCESSAWPGYHAFSDMFSAAWDDRDPAWEDFDILSGYLNRLEAYASAGTAKLDLAFWHNDKTVMTAPIQSLGLTDYGWSYECLNGTVLDAEEYPLACVTDGRLAAEGSAYQALVLYHTNGLDRADIGRLGELADEGLPVIFAGELPQSSYGLSDALFAREEWRAALEALLARENVYTCADDAAALDALLRSLGLCPAADTTRCEDILSIHRRTETADDYWFYNAGGEAQTVTVTLCGQGVPYLYDLWSGAVTALEYEPAAQGVTVTLSLASLDTAAIILTEEELATPQNAATTSGETAQVLSLNEADWTLDVVSYTADPDAPNRRTGLRTELDTIALSALVPWRAIEGLETVSGVGTYTVCFKLDAAQAAMEAGLQLDTYGEIGWQEENYWAAEGRVYYPDGTAATEAVLSVEINGETLPPINQTSLQCSLGDYLCEGENTLVIRVATTLYNARYGESAYDYGLSAAEIVLQ